MKAYQFHDSGTCYLMNLPDGSQAIVSDRTLRDELVKSRLASPAYKELPHLMWKSAYQVKDSQPTVISVLQQQHDKALKEIALYFVRNYDAEIHDGSMAKLVENLNQIDAKLAHEVKGVSDA